VETKNTGGRLSAGIPFHPALICPTVANTKITVVNAGGLPSSGSSLASSYNRSTGQYALVTSKAHSAYAAIATRRTVNISAPFDPRPRRSPPARPTPPASRPHASSGAPNRVHPRKPTRDSANLHRRAPVPMALETTPEPVILRLSSAAKFTVIGSA
jgi:hypothetical protein